MRSVKGSLVGSEAQVEKVGCKATAQMQGRHEEAYATYPWHDRKW